MDAPKKNASAAPKDIVLLELDPEKEQNVVQANAILHGRYKILRVIGKGGFGVIFKAFDIKKQTYVAVKVEKKHGNHMPLPNGLTSLHLETYALATVHRSSRTKERRAEGFPKPYYFGFIKQGSEAKMLVMDLLGPSLEALFSICGRTFSIPTVLLIVDQLLVRIESIHNEGVLHRDIKPQNILIGLDDKKDVIYLIDFGLALVRASSEELQKVKENTEEAMGHLGTTRFMSCRAHKRLRQTKKDDLESLVYVLASLLNGGKLPWLNVNAKDDIEKHNKICEMKTKISMAKLFSDLPLEFGLFGKMVKQLKIDEEPRYQYYRNIFRGLGQSIGLDYNKRKFDWSGLDVGKLCRKFESC